MSSCEPEVLSTDKKEGWNPTYLYIGLYPLNTQTLSILSMRGLCFSSFEKRKFQNFLAFDPIKVKIGSAFHVHGLALLLVYLKNAIMHIFLTYKCRLLLLSSYRLLYEEI